MPVEGNVIVVKRMRGGRVDQGSTRRTALSQAGNKIGTVTAGREGRIDKSRLVAFARAGEHDADRVGKTRASDVDRLLRRRHIVEIVNETRDLCRQAMLRCQHFQHGVTIAPGTVASAPQIADR